MTPERDPSRTHFGYREVPAAEKSGLVSEVFRSVAGRYDLMNDLMSFGVHRVWKRYAIAMTQVRLGQRALDVAGGSGDMAALLAAGVGARGRVVLSDVNEAMLDVGRERLADRGIAGNVAFVRADAECLPFASDYFDCVTIAFGLRNVTHIDRALHSMLRVVKPGGCVVVLEFSQVTVEPLRRLYDAYSFSVLPWLGRLVADDAQSYRYLAESIRRHPNQETLKTMMEKTGFERVRYHNLSAGIVAVHKGYKF